MNPIVSPDSAADIMASVLRDVSGSRAALLLEIVGIEETHLSDKGTVAIPQISAAIERASKLALATE
jgi:hypothetical protein